MFSSLDCRFTLGFFQQNSPSYRKSVLAPLRCLQARRRTLVFFSSRLPTVDGDTARIGIRYESPHGDGRHDEANPTSWVAVYEQLTNEQATAAPSTNIIATSKH